MKVTLLAGGTGGAKLAHGFRQVLAPGELTVIVNVADDTELHGLRVSPDVDTVLYTLAGLANAETGWGVSGDTWTALHMLGRYGEPTWFRVGDADLATHVRRGHLLAGGASLTDATQSMAEALGVPSHILPATDDPVRTILQTDAGELEFQDYFVRLRQEPEVHSVRFDGIDRARPTDEVRIALDSAELIVIAPSNPIVSVEPILAGNAAPGYQPHHRGRRAQGSGGPHARVTRPRVERPRRCSHVRRPDRRVRHRRGGRGAGAVR